MIQYDPKEWFSLIFHVYSRYVIRTMFPLLTTMVVFSTVFCYLVIEVFQWELKATTAFHSILGIVLGLFLVLRTNSAYDRWWEGRKLWGKLVNDTRNLAFKLNTMFPGDQEIRHYFRIMIPNFVYSMKEFLRKGVLMEELTFIAPDEEKRIIEAQHKPNMIISLMYEKINGAYNEGKISGDQYFILDKELKGFTDVLGACERIKSTPIPYSFNMYIKKFLFYFTLTLPIATVSLFGYWTILIVSFLFYILVGIELISEEIEDPFGTDINDLPLDGLSRKIRNNIQEVLPEVKAT